LSGDGVCIQRVSVIYAELGDIGQQIMITVFVCVGDTVPIAICEKWTYSSLEHD